MLNKIIFAGTPAFKAFEVSADPNKKRQNELLESVYEKDRLRDEIAPSGLKDNSYFIEVVPKNESTDPVDLFEAFKKESELAESYKHAGLKVKKDIFKEYKQVELKVSLLNKISSVI